MGWSILWAGLFIVVLYSPIGSPDYYSSTGNYYGVNQPVLLTNGKILYAPKANSKEVNNPDEFNIPDVNLTPKPITGNVQYPSGNVTSGGSSNGTMLSPSYHNGNVASEGMSSGGVFTISGGTKSGSGSSGNTMTNGNTTISTSSDINNSNSKQSVTNQTTGNNGGTDPGGDPTGDPIPVGNGWRALLLFGVVYAMLKKKKFYI